MCAATAILDDDITDIFGEFDRVALPVEQAAAKPAPEDVLHYEPCRKCRGTGRFISYSGRAVGPCFTCKGKGKIGFKTSPEARAARQQNKTDAQAEAFKAFVSAYPTEFGYVLVEAQQGDSFFTSLMDQVTKKGSLTENQIAAVRRQMTRDAERKAEVAAIKATAPTVLAASLARIEQAFANAMSRQIQHPKMRLDTFIFSPAPADGKNVGAIYVKDVESREYLGKIAESKFQRVRACTPDQEQRIVAAASDPASAATAYGQRTGSCSICGRKLTKAESIDRAIGPICAANFGF